MTSLVNCGYNVTTSGDHLYEDSLILIVQFSSQAIGGGLYRWLTLTLFMCLYIATTGWGGSEDETSGLEICG